MHNVGGALVLSWLPEGDPDDVICRLESSMDDWTLVGGD